MPLNLIWTQEPQSLSEANWIRWLFQPFDPIEHVSPRLELFKDESIYVVSHPLGRLPSWFLECIRPLHGKGLFHISDESFSGRYEVYTNFDFVLRNYHSVLFEHPGIKILPLRTSQHHNLKRRR
jgi:hypothetical protein